MCCIRLSSLQLPEDGHVLWRKHVGAVNTKYCATKVSVCVYWTVAEGTCITLKRNMKTQVRFIFAGDIKSSNEMILGCYNSRGGINITRTRQSVRLYVHCPSCLRIMSSSSFTNHSVLTNAVKYTTQQGRGTHESAERISSTCAITWNSQAGAGWCR